MCKKQQEAEAEKCSQSGYKRSWVTGRPCGNRSQPALCCSLVSSRVWGSLLSLLSAGKDISRGQPHSQKFLLQTLPLTSITATSCPRYHFQLCSRRLGSYITTQGSFSGPREEESAQGQSTISYIYLSIPSLQNNFLTDLFKWWPL